MIEKSGTAGGGNPLETGGEHSRKPRKGGLMNDPIGKESHSSPIEILHPCHEGVRAPHRRRQRTTSHRSTGVDEENRGQWRIPAGERQQLLRPAFLEDGEGLPRQVQHPLPIPRHRHIERTQLDPYLLIHPHLRRYQERFADRGLGAAGHNFEAMLEVCLANVDQPGPRRLASPADVAPVDEGFEYEGIGSAVGEDLDSQLDLTEDRRARRRLDDRHRHPRWNPK